MDLLRHRSADAARASRYTFLGETGELEASWTHAELDLYARRIAGALAGVEPGARAVLLYPPGLDYIAGFFGCLYAGLVAVPAYPPDPSRLERTLPRLRAIIEDSRATVVLTTSFILSMKEFLTDQAPELNGLHWAATDALEPGAEDGWRPPVARPDTLAFLQYTSGSTGMPKGVMLTHGNLLHNLDAIHRSFRASADSVGVIWLPPYHDMGLIGGILEPLNGGFPVTLMSPLTFLRRPLVWLEAISQYKGTISGGPNFAFDLCARRISEEERARLDLSSWEVAFCGAEPIRTETLERFNRTFGPQGFRAPSLYPCYGLAEGTLIATGVAQGAGASALTLEAEALARSRAVRVEPGTPGSRELVGCGQSMPDQSMLIVDPEARTPRADGEVGEIWLRGPSIAQGYWQRPEQTEEAFQARLASTGEGPFLRTGDLGFVVDGELYVTGRRKDLIILRGRNHYPQDLELTAERAHPAIRPGSGAAFSVDVAGEERLVQVHEVSLRDGGDLGPVLAAVRQALSEEHELQPHALILVEPGSVPKTSSGKIQRRACRESFLDGSLRVVTQWEEGSALEAHADVHEDAGPGNTAESMGAWLRSRVAARLRVRPDEVSATEPITRLGLDSLAAVELSHDIEKGLGVILPMEALLQGPTIAELAGRVLAHRAGSSRLTPPLKPRNREELPALSFAQQRLWFLDALVRGSPAYHIPVAVRLVGPLHVPALQHALDVLVRRHETLRTTFVSRDGVPAQRILPDLPVTLDQVDVSGREDRAEETARLARVEAARSFDLETGPLMRALLVKEAEGEHVLVVVMHHIVSDGWSMGVMVREVGKAYEAKVKGVAAQEEALDVQYADWAAWQREWLEGGALEEQLGWWKQQLAGAPSALELPTDKPRPVNPTFRAHTVDASLSRSLSEAVKGLAKQEGVTPFMVLLAAWQVVLAKHAGQDDVSVGTPIAGRQRAETEGLIGFFVNTLVVRTKVAGGASFRELLGQVRETTLGAYAHQDVPFEKLVEALQPARDLARHPLFQVMLAFQQDSLPELKLPGLALRAVPLDSGAVKFDLSLNLSETAEGFTGTLISAADLFHRASTERMVRHWHTLLEAATVQPGLRVDALPLLDEEARRAVLEAWPEERLAAGNDTCLHALFEAQAARVPDAVAVVGGGQSLTYRALDAGANQLAGALRAMGVGPDARVGLCVDRRADAMRGLLGILKAGGAYVPLDPANPGERLRLMLDEARVDVVVTIRELASRFDGHPGRLVLLDDGAAPFASFPSDAPPARGAVPSNLAYVIFTSGSTGRPRSVGIEHRQIVRYVRGLVRRLDLSPGASFASVSTLAADLGHTALFPTLAQGGTLHLVDTETASDPAALGAYFARHGVEGLKIVPSHLRALLASESPERLLPRRWLVLGGESSDWALVDQVRSLVPGCAVFNHYGPTETTVGVLTLPASALAREDRPVVVPLGRPLPEVRAYVLDAGLRPVPPGVAGALYIAGGTVGRGYLGRPELTADRFIPSPFAKTPGERMYRTGDRARLGPDGAIVFLGREDDQLKVRGFRVEPGEVEAVLKQHPAIAEAVVVARDAGGGERRLVAYGVPTTGGQLVPDLLKTFLEERLPSYLVPSAVVVLETLPLTANGKVDRRALPEPAEFARAEPSAPGTPYEALLASVWAQVLGVSDVGPGDDFFERGGHSLLATRAVSRIRSVFQVDLPLRALFETPKLGALARRLEALSRTGADAVRPPVVPVPRDRPLPLSFAQQRLWFLDRMEPGNALYNVPAMLWLDGALDAEALERSLAEILLRHEVLRTTFHETPDGAVQRVAPAPARALTHVNLHDVAPDALEARALEWAREEASRPFDLVAGPPVRMSLLALRDDRHVLVLVMHHIVADGWSLGVLVRELGALYGAFTRGTASGLPALAVQYADHAVWQRGWLQGAVREAQLSWWREQLQDAPRVLDLPLARHRPKVRTSQGAQATHVLPRATAEAVRQLALREGATPFMVMMAGFQALLHRYTGRTDLLVGTDIANRHHAETEALVGFFVNQVVLRTRPTPVLPFRALLGQVREAALGAYAHQDLPFEELVRDLNPERSLGASPLFQVKLIFQNARDAELALPGLSLRVESIDPGASKFDLTVAFSDTSEGLSGLWEYSTDLFDAATVARMQEHLRTLLEGALSRPDGALETLPLLTEAERAHVLGTWNAATLPIGEPLRVHRRFEAAVATFGDRPALRFEGQDVSYRELEARSNALARHLRAQGVGLETRVGICLERSPELVIAMLATLKAGGAFVPLDPAYPSARLTFMLQDSAVPVVVTRSELADELPATGAHLVCLDEDAARLERLPGTPLEDAGAPEHLAYVIYTSGSTGRPKGTLLTHGGLCNTAVAVGRAHGVHPDSRVLQFASSSFDAGVCEVFSTLLAGACLVLAPKDALLPGPALERTLTEQAITTVTLTPSVLAQQSPEGLTRLETIISAGEACPPEVVRRWSPGRRFINAYGPTEITVCATLTDQPLSADRVTIGGPLANVRVYVLSPALQPVPPGVPGELYVGGAGVGRGYLGHPSLTAERFMPDPFATEPGARMYRTGDRARWLEAGALEFLGRSDAQVKVRGFRIELEEVEAVLGAQAGVQAAAATVREEASGVRRLVGYVVPFEGAAVDEASLRDGLRRRLPEHMVPSAFVVLDALPLSPNGKVDRSALPALGGRPTREEATFVEPSTPAERLLASLWQQILRVERVGADDNFFELGGDSIISLQVVAQARRAGLAITPKQLFEHQKLRDLAAAATLDATPAVADAGPASGTVPLTPIQRWFLEQGSPAPEHYNQAVLLAARESLDAGLVEAALRALWRHHDALRLRFTRACDGWSQQYGSPDEAVDFLVREDLSGLPEEAREARLEQVATRVQGSLDLGSGPLMRAVLFTMGVGQPARLLWVIHHLVVDGVSWRTLLEDFESAYLALRDGQAPALPPRTTSFKTWAERLESYAATDAVAAEAEVWAAQARVPVEPLPLDGPGGENTVASARTVAVELDAETTRLLLREAPTAWRARVDELLLSAVARALGQVLRVGRVRVTLEGHGRDVALPGVDVSRTVGWFTAAYPVVLDVAGRGSEGDLLRAVRDSVRTVSGRGASYGMLRHLRGDDVSRGLGVQPAPPVAFNYLGQFDGLAAGLTLLEPASGSTGLSKAPGALRTEVLSVGARVLNERLRLEWTFSEHLHQRATVEALAGASLESVRSLVALRSTPDALRYTPADFPLANLSADILERILPPGEAVEDVYPLSPLQEGLLFHGILAPESGAYFEQVSCSFHAPLNVQAFHRAWQEAVATEPVLRTAFRWEGLERPRQVVFSRAELPWRELDWRGLSPEEQEARLVALRAEDRARGLELTHAPLMRMSLIRTDARVHHLVWSFHHLLMDGWSVGLLLRRIFSLYEAFGQGRALPRSEGATFRDYIAWLQHQDLGRAERYWRDALAGLTQPTPLPEDRGAARASDSRMLRRLSLSGSVTSALQEFARQQQVTLNTLVQAAWGLMLGRCAGLEDVVFGATVSGRPPEIEGVESTVGLLINSLPVRVRMPGDAVLGPWLQAFQQRQAEQRQYEFSPLVEVQGWSGLSRGASLFEALLVFENYPLDSAVWEWARNLEVRGFVVSEWTNYPLTCVVVPGRELELKLLHDVGRFAPESADAMLRHLGTLLEAFVSHADARLDALPMLSTMERQQVLAWGQPKAPALDPAPNVHQRFEAWAAKTPDAVAVTYEQASLTYGELNRRANQLAHHLRKQGVGPEVRVGLCVERSLEMLVGLLAILKAGGAYVPLDPSYPAERLAFLLEDADVPLLLTQARLVPTLPASRPVFRLDADWDRVAGEPTQDPAPSATPENGCYVIYTSGSTGKPKGMQIEHARVTRLFTATAPWFSFGSDEVWTLFHSYAFDFSVWEIWGALIHGARLVIVPYLVSRSPEAFRALVHDEGVTVLNQTPSAFLQFVQADAARATGGASSLRWIIFGGETLEFSSLRAWFERHGDARPKLVNMYGITETTVHVTFRPLTAEDAAGAQPSSVGVPIPDLQVYVLDARGELAPMGVPGELFVGGEGPGRGYLKRPALTAERFVPDPFSGRPGGRLYRTGDLGRWRSTGELDHLGRIDHQVKLRGFRIELGEIEAALRAHPNVRDAVVLVRTVAGDARLVGYVTARDGAHVDPWELRRVLRERLPDYMVPQALVPLEAFPLTSHGKLAREALPLPEAVDTEESSSADVAPRTPTEELLADIWASVLGVARVGRDDDFFELGGHSLLATQVVSRLHSVFPVKVPLRELFENPTVAALGQWLDAALGAKTGAEAIARIPSRVRGEGESLPLSFAQQRLWFLDRLTPGSAAYNIQAALRLKGPLDVAALEQAFTHVVQRHEALRTTFGSVEGRPFQRIASDSSFALRRVDVSGGEDHARETARVATEEAQRPFDLEAGPLMRALLVKEGEGEHVLVVVMHHIVSDGWSMGVMVREVGKAYEAKAKGTAAQEEALEVQYADWAAWQREWLEGGALEEQLGWWRQRLAGAPSALELPTDKPRPVVPSTEGASLDVRLSRSLADAVKALAKQEGVTPFMVLLAAWQVVLARHAGQDDVSVGTPIAGRHHAQTEGLIGFFVNTLVLRAKVETGATFRELLAQVRETTLGAYAHQDVPFEKLVEALQPARDLARHPLFQVLFTLQNTPVTPWAVPDLSAAPYALSRRASKFDLALSLTEQEDGFAGSVEYSTDLYEERTVRRWMDGFERVVRALVEKPERRVGDVEWMGAEERRRVVEEWNRTGKAYGPKGECGHEVFESVADARPEAEAVRTEAGGVSYGEVEERANQLAHHLRGLGVGPEVRVGLLVERSVEWVVGMVAVLKAGGAFVPVDVTLPALRVGGLLEESGVAMVLTSQRFAGLVPNPQTPVVLMDADAVQVAKQPKTRPTKAVSPESMAYVLFTSGSTGKPKGVVVRHGGLANMAHAVAEAHGVKPEDRVLQFASPGFDASVAEVFSTLAAGASLCLAPREALMPGGALEGTVKQLGATVVTLTPSVLGQVVDGGLDGIRTLISAGEAVPSALVRKWSEGLRMLNGYGPTEVTVCASVATSLSPERVTVGKPLGNVRLYVLDEGQRPVGVGVVGELYVGGAGLARGYLGQPALTAERFIPDGFSGEAGSRLYRTGDLVRWGEDGEVEYVGRRDGQVKVRGMRLEVGEVEGVLAMHPAVKQAAVVARKEATGTKLWAYVVGDVETAALREWLRERVPEHMVPTAYGTLDALPLTSSGKVDRSKLPALTAESTRTQAFVPPTTELERSLTALWQEVLGVERVGLEDRFFDLGGNSLTLVQLHSRMRGLLKVEVPLAELFQYSSIAALVARVRDRSDPVDAPSEAAVEEEFAERRARAGQRRKVRQQVEVPTQEDSDE
ncbi:non-ribosomal peptide synthase/polyketide synthase [Corallococcus sp. AB011P]|uniref:non-ribosomal peptide synthase/polyketide synthase n=1 Tax=Corallococcus sp. AB011P TaxID=2316735 RepID=UPI0013158683|nr:non-ribosomal peptide synthase/polyketide synthase [Corallococcus sp. AB011P]